MGVLFVFGVLVNAAQTRAELTEDIGASLKLGAIWSYSRATWGKVMIKNITFGFLATGMILLGMLACYIGLYPVAVIIQLAGVHLRWQVYHWYIDRGGQAIPVAELKPLAVDAMPVPAQ
jgi:hypothetical protein